MFSSVHFSGCVPVLDRSILGRQAERVPAEGMQHVEAEHPLHPRHHVANHVVADVPHVGVARGVGEHLEAVVLRSGGLLRHLERAGAGPPLLPLLLYSLGLIVGHDPSIIWPAGSGGPGQRPNPKLQVPRHSQLPISKINSQLPIQLPNDTAIWRGATWRLVVGSALELGTWSLVVRRGQSRQKAACAALTVAMARSPRGAGVAGSGYDAATLPWIAAKDASRHASRALRS